MYTVSPPVCTLCQLFAFHLIKCKIQTRQEKKPGEHMAVSEAKKKANKKWDDAHKELMKYYRYRSYSKTFINELAEDKDLEELEKLITSKREK